MMEQEALNRLFAASGAAGWGCCSFNDAVPEEPVRSQALSLCPNAGGILIAAYPYYAGNRPGNLSLYARGEDYHSVLLRRLGIVCEGLEALYPGYNFVPGADNSPLPEHRIARLSGLGLQGRNGMVILPPWGSWLFLGTILTDLKLETPAEQAPPCMNCGACVRACPGGALRSSPFDEDKCLSALTQKKGALSPEQEKLVKAHPLIWGCDICQTVCPYNKEAEHSHLTDLTGEDAGLPYLSDLTEADLEGLTNKTFKQKYGNRAFAWRGPAVLRRNLKWKKETD